MYVNIYMYIYIYGHVTFSMNFHFHTYRSIDMYIYMRIYTTHKSIQYRHRSAALSHVSSYVYIYMHKYIYIDILISNYLQQWRRTKELQQAQEIRKVKFYDKPISSSKIVFVRLFVLFF